MYQGWLTAAPDWTGAVSPMYEQTRGH